MHLFPAILPTEVHISQHALPLPYFTVRLTSSQEGNPYFTACLTSSQEDNPYFTACLTSSSDGISNRWLASCAASPPPFSPLKSRLPMSLLVPAFSHTVAFFPFFFVSGLFADGLYNTKYTSLNYRILLKTNFNSCFQVKF